MNHLQKAEENVYTLIVNQDIACKGYVGNFFKDKHKKFLEEAIKTHKEEIRKELLIIAHAEIKTLVEKEQEKDLEKALKIYERARL